MAGTTVYVAKGTIVAFATSSWTSEILSIGHDGVADAPPVDVSHMGTANVAAGEIGNILFKTIGLVDPGTFAFGFHFDPDNLPPVDGVEEVITLTFPKESGDTTASKYVFTGAALSYSWSADHKGKIVGQLQVKALAGIVRTAAA